jgi:hypothetical protein
MKSYKIPSLDSLQPIFFKKTVWDIIGINNSFIGSECFYYNNFSFRVGAWRLGVSKKTGKPIKF